MTRRRWGVFLALIAIVLDATLLVSGQRVLVWQRSVPAGQPSKAEGYESRVGDQASIDCWYFTGRSVRSTNYWYSPSGFMGKDECPFLTNAGD